MRGLKFVMEHMIWLYFERFIFVARQVSPKKKKWMEGYEFRSYSPEKLKISEKSIKGVYDDRDQIFNKLQAEQHAFEGYFKSQQGTVPENFLNEMNKKTPWLKQLFSVEAYDLVGKVQDISMEIGRIGIFLAEAVAIIRPDISEKTVEMIDKITKGSDDE